MQEFEGDLRAIRPASPSPNLEEAIQRAMLSGEETPSLETLPSEEALQLRLLKSEPSPDLESVQILPEEAEFELWLRQNRPLQPSRSLEANLESEFRYARAQETSTAQPSAKRWWIAASWAALAAGVALAFNTLDPWSRPASNLGPASSQSASTGSGLALAHGRTAPAASGNRSKNPNNPEASPNSPNPAQAADADPNPGLAEAGLSEGTGRPLVQIQGVNRQGSSRSLAQAIPGKKNGSSEPQSDSLAGPSWGRVVVSGSSNALALASNGDLLDALAEGRLSDLLKSEAKTRNANANPNGTSNPPSSSNGKDPSAPGNDSNSNSNSSATTASTAGNSTASLGDASLSSSKNPLDAGNSSPNDLNSSAVSGTPDSNSHPTSIRLEFSDGTVWAGDRSKLYEKNGLLYTQQSSDGPWVLLGPSSTIRSTAAYNGAGTPLNGVNPLSGLTATSIHWAQTQDPAFNLDMSRLFINGPLLIEDDNVTLKLSAQANGNVTASLISRKDGAELSFASESLVYSDVFSVNNGLWNGALLNSLGVRLATEAKTALGIPTTPPSKPTVQPGD
jgi:hypothetical protein